MNIADDIAEEMMALFSAVERHDLDAALRHYENARVFTGLAKRRLEIEIVMRKMRGQPADHILKGQEILKEVIECLDEQQKAVDALIRLMANMSSRCSGVVGKS